MTNFKRVEEYYRHFDEWNRLLEPSGQLEFDLTLKTIVEYVTPPCSILDLGGGPGHYTTVLASLGFHMHLADLSQELLDFAKDKVNELNLSNVHSINRVNAIDLGIYEDHRFDAILLMGPLYHLTTQEEQIQCIQEVHRILKRNGIVIASFIPKLAGSIGIVDRAINSPHQVNSGILDEVFKHGVFHNALDHGFQEGFYPTPSYIEHLFSANGFKKEAMKSIRGFSFGREEHIINLRYTNKALYETIINWVNETSTHPSIIDTCAHALYIGVKV